MNSGASGLVVADTTSQPASVPVPSPTTPTLSSSSSPSTKTTTSTTIAIITATWSSTSTTPSSKAKSSQINSNLIEILGDNSNFVDIRHQDSGSNQSGSDSGLGHNNSVSSDNSTFTTIVQENHSNNKTTNSSSIKQTAAGSNPTKSKNNKLSSIDESRIIPDDATSKRSSSDVASEFNRQEAKKLDEAATKTADCLDAHPIVSSLQQQQNLPVLKSLLKKPSRLLVQSDSTTSKPHKRHVSFNQTVIVFCEEIEAPSPSDQFESQLDYPDTSAAFDNFEIPKDYREHGIAVSRKEETSGPVANSLDGAYDDKPDADGLAKALGTDNASNLTDDQLLGLLEDESLLESFRLNCEDFSDDEFPANYLNSNHSYLCNEAISDYDSDSQSSLCIDRKDVRPFNAPVRNTIEASEKSNSIEFKDTTNLAQSQLASANGTSHNPRIKQSDEAHIPHETKFIGHKNTVKSNRASTIMPARMKVSTLDTAHQKRQSHHDHDLKSRAEQTDKIGSKDDKQNSNNRETVPTSTLLVKQSTIEPLPKFKIVSTNKPDQAQSINNKSNMDLLYDSNLQDPFANPKLLNNEEFMRTRASVSSSKGQGLQNNQTSNINLNQVQTSHAQTETVCHICRAIETNRSHVNKENHTLAGRVDISKQMNSDINNNHHHESYISLNQIRAAPNTVTNKPAEVSNQSCASCRDASNKQLNAAPRNEPTQALNADLAQQPRPVACQLVYVVDQKGNRVRALSVIRPPNQNSANSGQQVLAGRRIFIAPNGVRFPNPVSVVQPVNLPNNSMNTSHWQSQNLTNNGNTQQYRILSAVQPQPPTQTHRGQFVIPQSGDIGTIATPNSYKPHAEGLAMRPHTVYYVRQPLGLQNTRQSFDTNRTNIRSFPDPHEIRRLDGLRGPPTAIHLAQRLDFAGSATKVTSASGGEASERPPGETASKVQDSAKGEMDDPTFGFSKRPSVKVVATSNPDRFVNVGPKLGNVCCDGQEHLPPHTGMLNVRRTHMIDETGSVKPISVVLLGSQTLDRRILNQQCAFSIKENLPSTSSMSNIHGTLTSLKRGESSNDSCHQPKISGASQSNNPNLRDNSKVQGMISKGLKRWLADKLIFN